MSHVVLLGDSIFDNASYVPRGPCVIQQLREQLPDGWQATLRAVDGAVTRSVAQQVRLLPPDATHLVVSVGGNDGLSYSGVLYESVRTVAEALTQLADTLGHFQRDYREMLAAVL